MTAERPNLPALFSVRLDKAPGSGGPTSRASFGALASPAQPAPLPVYKNAQMAPASASGGDYRTKPFPSSN